MGHNWWFNQGKQWGSENVLRDSDIRAAFADLCDDLPWGEGGEALAWFRSGAVAAQLEAVR